MTPRPPNLHTQAGPSEPSPFHEVFGRVFADLAKVGVNPVVAGAWAAGAHGVLAPIDVFEAVVSEAQLPALHSFLVSRGASPDLILGPAAAIEFGRRPWALRLALRWNGATAETATSSHVTFDATNLAVLSPESVMAAGDALAEPTRDALRAILDGTSELDGGERGLAAWDAIGRLTASAAYPDILSRPPHRSVDFQLARRL